MTRHEARVQCFRLFRQQSRFHRNACGRQTAVAAAVDLRIRIDHRRHHTRQTRGNQRVCTGRRATEMTTRFKRDVGGCAGHWLRARRCVTQCCNFSVGATRRLRKAFADHPPITYQHTAHTGVRRGVEPAARSQCQRMCHVSGVSCGVSCGGHPELPVIVAAPVTFGDLPSSGSRELHAPPSDTDLTVSSRASRSISSANSETS